MSSGSSKEFTMAEVATMIQDLEEGVIDHARLEILNTLISSDPRVTKLYCDHMELACLLETTASNQRQLAAMKQNMLPKLQPKKKSPFSMVAGIAAAALVCLGFYYFAAQNRAMEETPLITLKFSKGAVYDVSDAEGRSGDLLNLQVADNIQVQSGLAKLSFPSGVEAVIEGPAELSILSSGSISLSTGKAWFRVPEAGHGFTIHCKKFKVVDLGTEFGLSVSANERAEVHVANGEVEVQPSSEDLGSFKLEANGASQISSSGLGTEIAFDAQIFQSEFTDQTPYIYWSFDEMENGGFAAQGTLPDVEKGFVRLETLDESLSPLSADELRSHHVKGLSGSALSLRGNGVFANTSFRGIGGNTPRTIAAWVRHRKGALNPSGAVPYLVWGARSEGRLWKFVIHEEGARFKPGNTIAYTTAYLTTSISDLPHDFSEDAWMHVASVYTGKIKDGVPEIWHFINGVRQVTSSAEAEAAINTDTSSEASYPLRFGASLNSDKSSISVNGDLDEVYLFRGVLDEDQIKRLMRGQLP